MKKGNRFKAEKRVEQSDLPSTLFWVAVLDPLLVILRNQPSEFKVQDLDGNTHPAEDLGFADDLQSQKRKPLVETLFSMDGGVQ